MSGIIYQITCTATNQKYIGQATKHKYKMANHIIMEHLDDGAIMLHLQRVATLPYAKPFSNMEKTISQLKSLKKVYLSVLMNEKHIILQSIIQYIHTDTMWQVIQEIVIEIHPIYMYSMKVKYNLLLFHLFAITVNIKWHMCILLC